MTLRIHECAVRPSITNSASPETIVLLSSGLCKFGSMIDWKCVVQLGYVEKNVANNSAWLNYCNAYRKLILRRRLAWGTHRFTLFSVPSLVSYTVHLCGKKIVSGREKKQDKEDNKDENSRTSRKLWNLQKLCPKVKEEFIIEFSVSHKAE